MTRHAMVPSKPLIMSLTARRAIDDLRRPGEIWTMLRRTWALWRHRARTRAELRLIPSHQLNDLPFDTSAIVSERKKAFWKG